MHRHYHSLLLAASLFGCKKEAGNLPSGNQQINNPPAAMQNADSDFELKLASASFDYDKVFTDRDISAKYDESIYKLTLKDNASACDNHKTAISKNTVTVNTAGTYIVSGELTDGQIIVDAEDTDKVQLVLSNASVNKNSGAAILVRSAKKVFVTLENGSKNTLTSTGEFDKTENNKADGVIYSKEKLTLNGKGSLNITSDSGHAIVCNDDMIITSGEYTVNAKNQALKAKDSISFAGGNFKIAGGKDAIHCENEDDAGKGNAYFSGASLDINAGDDAFQASGYIIIDGGTINVLKCNEGIEAQKIEINGGNIIVPGYSGMAQSKAQYLSASTRKRAKNFP